MSTEDVLRYLERVSDRPAEPSSEVVRRSLSSLKAKALSRGDQDGAKALWSLEQALGAQEHYLKAFGLLKLGKFYDAWCELERAELVLGALFPHGNSLWARLRLDCIQRYTEKWQSLYPYRIFLSPELVELEKKCSICGQVVAPRKSCGHLTGEIYDGQMCVRIITKMEVLGVAMVEKPVQKYSVVFLSDPTTGKSRDHYNYAVVQYAISAIQDPFHEWEVEQTSRFWPHSKFSHIGRNDPCPCQSGRKYKKCCLLKKGVVFPHWEFRFAVKPPPGTPTEFLSLNE
jgi:uncharacterized protein YecA (UPF0149 family)